MQTQIKTSLHSKGSAAAEASQHGVRLLLVRDPLSHDTFALLPDLML